MSLHPSEGIRLLLVRESVDADEVRAEYAAHVYTSTESFEYAAALSIDGDAELTARGQSAAVEDEKRLLNIAKSTARAAKRKRDDGLAPWPHRVLRWRK